MMNTPHKSVTNAFLAVSIFISGLSEDLVSVQSSVPRPMVTRMFKDMPGKEIETTPA